MNPVTYSNDYFIFDNESYDGILVLDVNTQGIIDLTEQGRRFKRHFPETYKMYIKKCLDDELKGGDIIVYWENNYIIALLVTAESITPITADTNVMKEIFIERSINTLLNEIMDYDKLIMTIPMRNDPEMSAYFMQIIRTKSKVPVTIFRN